MKLVKYWLIIVLGVISQAVVAENSQLTFAKQLLTINGIKLQVELAATEQQRQQGLMFRKSIEAGQGMLFYLDEDSMPCFWMKNTYIPLSLAFIDKQKQIVQIEQLQPESLNHVCAMQPISYALEVPQGWFSEQGIDIGMLVEGINHPIP
ncbi:DUF192 domain-containing protein [Entomomonas asaccharolytica]|uniref:DUF192 domain-containing protein n=1 Tax=Entomomonas asaccharolytica TaxID=2785331 RepID=A0A974RX58_9GAMM|nr:DUF192 domain-containing protein [Entomomonas asaccharolytica]QQP85911.1 DUF192 domain-containing protein [Entomomonas asaccharolytica]